MCSNTLNISVYLAFESNWKKLQKLFKAICYKRKFQFQFLYRPIVKSLELLHWIQFKSKSCLKSNTVIFWSIWKETFFQWTLKTTKVLYTWVIGMSLNIYMWVKHVPFTNLFFSSKRFGLFLVNLNPMKINRFPPCAFFEHLCIQWIDIFRLNSFADNIKFSSDSIINNNIWVFGLNWIELNDRYSILAYLLFS